MHPELTDPRPTVIDLAAGLSIISMADDPDYLLAKVVVSDGAFAGSTRVYESYEMPLELAAELRGFPRAPGDRREYVLGSFGPKTAGGGVRLVFYTDGLAGHPVLDVQLEDEPSEVATPRTVTLRFALEAAAIDEFVRQLPALTSDPPYCVTLPGAA